MRASASDAAVQSLVRGLSVIRAFDSEHVELTLSEVARRASISPAAAGRFLRTLEHVGYVRSNGRRFALTPRVLELGFSYLSALSLPEMMQPHLGQLSAEVDESVSAAVLSAPDTVYVARVPTRRIMTVAITIGTRFSAYATSMGRVLLAELPDEKVREILAADPPRQLTPQTTTSVDALLEELALVRMQGWSLVDSELELGLRSLAVPVHGKDGQVAAAFNVSTSATRASLERMHDFYLPSALATGKSIDAELRLLEQR